MKTGLFACAFLFLSFNSATAQVDSQNDVADALFKDTKEIYFSFTLTDKSELKTLTNIISIDHGYDGGNTVKAYANKKGFLAFLQYNHPYTILKRPNQLAQDIKMIKG